MTENLSTVNLTETRNTLSLGEIKSSILDIRVETYLEPVTKAGVPNNKIYVGEASYGRSFRMAQDLCWQSMCEFTGSREHSDANPGRCTGTGGYISHAEINEIIQAGGDIHFFHEGESNTDILLYKGESCPAFTLNSHLELPGAETRPQHEHTPTPER